MANPVRRPKKRPCVVVFFTDQQRHDSTGLGGNPLGLTPNFDRLARENAHLAHTFTPNPVCGPARACLQTGTYSTTNGVYKNGITMPPNDVLPNLGSLFKNAGYTTGYIGKWHLTGHEHKGPVPPDQRGGYDQWLAANLLEFTSDAYETTLYDNDGQPVRLPGYRVDALTDAAIRFVDEHKDDDEPFFLFVSQLEPHHQNHVDDYPPPIGYREAYAGRWTPPDLAALPTAEQSYNFEQATVGGSAARHLGGYWGMVKRLDEAYGRLHDALYSLGLDRDTITVFTSDHACHFKTRNGEYKRSVHDSSLRVPCAITGPGFAGGGEPDGLTSLLDLPPTLLEACGIGVPGTMQGRSLMPLVRREVRPGEGWPDDVYAQVSEAHYGRAVRTKRWKYGVLATHNERADAVAGKFEDYDEAFLYDLQHDPHEMQNLISSAEHAGVREVMRGRLVERMKQAGEPSAAIHEYPSPRSYLQRVVSDVEAQM